MRLRARVADRTLEVAVAGKDGRYRVTLDGAVLDVDLVETGDHFASLLVDGRCYDMGIEEHLGGYRVHGRDHAITVEMMEASTNGSSRPGRAEGPARLTAPMPGRVVRVLVSEGRDVDVGQGLVVIEAMKMENELKAPRSGHVHEVAVREGQAVDAGALLVVVA